MLQMTFAFVNSRTYLTRKVDPRLQLTPRAWATPIRCQRLPFQQKRHHSFPPTAVVCRHDNRQPRQPVLNLLNPTQQCYVPDVLRNMQCLIHVVLSVFFSM